MAEELSSTNINDLINDDTEINDDVVDSILNELENTNTEQDIDLKMNDFRNDDFRNDDFRNDDFRNDDFRNDDFRNLQNNTFKKEDFDSLQKDNMENESESTIKKINTILNLDADYNCSILDVIVKDMKYPIMVIVLSLLLNNSFLTNILSDLLSKIINNDFINDNISLVIRALLSGIIFYFLYKFI